MDDADRAAWESELRPGPSWEGSAEIDATESRGHAPSQAGEGSKSARRDVGGLVQPSLQTAELARGSVKTPERSDLELHPLCPKPRGFLGPGGDPASDGAECASRNLLTRSPRGGTRAMTPNHRLPVTSDPINGSPFPAIASPGS